jgi:hypothetical protein
MTEARKCSKVLGNISKGQKCQCEESKMGIKKNNGRCMPVAYACNPSYSQIRMIEVQSQPWSNSSRDPVSQKTP